jgi:hypothetical protein
VPTEVPEAIPDAKADSTSGHWHINS